MTPSAIRDVYVLAHRDGQVLLLLRTGTGYRDGEWGLPSGKVEPGETYAEAAARELQEETGLEAPDARALRLVHVVERVTATGVWLGIFFHLDVDGDPVNREPHKHGDIGWFDPSALPRRTSDYVAHAVDAIARGDTYTAWRE